MRLIDCGTAKNPGAQAIVDDDDFEDLSKWKWALDSRGYISRAHTGRHGSKIFMHRQIMRVLESRDAVIDHINGNTRDNRRENLRVCNTSQNGRNRGAPSNNTSGYKGVSWNKRDRKWQARISAGGKNLYLGSFDSPEKAHDAYCSAAKLAHGEFANYGWKKHHEKHDQSRLVIGEDCSSTTLDRRYEPGRGLHPRTGHGSSS
jgi:hypothetical protein